MPAPIVAGLRVHRWFGRADSEHRQAVLRWSIALVVVVLIALGEPALRGAPLALGLLQLGLASALGCWVLARPGPVPARRWAAVLVDHALLGGWLMVLGPMAEPLAIGFVLLVLDHGLRFGLRMAWLAAGAAIAACLLVLAVETSWHNGLTLVGTMAAVVAVAWYQYQSKLQQLRRVADGSGESDWRDWCRELAGSFSLAGDAATAAADTHLMIDREPPSAGDDAGKVVAFDDPWLRHRARVPPLSVLVVDEQPGSRLVLCRVLERAGHRVEAVADTESLLDRLAEGDFDVLIVDLDLPDSRGLETVRQARYLEVGGSRTPLLALTADDHPAIRVAAERAGASMLLHKPIPAVALLDALARVACSDSDAKLASPTQTHDSSVLDSSVLHELAELRLGGDFVQTFVDQCLRDATRCLANLEACAQRSDWAGVRDAIHAVKGVASNMGAVGLVALCDQELAPSPAELPKQWRSYSAALHEHLARVRVEITSLVAELLDEGAADHRGGQV